MGELSGFEPTGLSILSPMLRGNVPLGKAAQTILQGDLGSRGYLELLQLATPATPTITNVGTAGATTYGYKVVATVNVGVTAASAEGTTATGNATLTASNYNTITWVAIPGATGYKIYRTTGGTTPPMLIATITSGAQTTYDDTDKTSGSSETPSTTNTTGKIVAAYGATLTSPAINGTVTTTGLTLPLFTPDAELEAYLLKLGNILFVQTVSGWTAVVTGSGSTSQAVSFNQLSTGATVSSSAMLSVTMYGFSLITGSFINVNWDKKMYYIFNYVRQTTDTEAVGRVQIKEVDDKNALTAKGLGIKVLNFALWGESYGTELGEVDLGVTLTTFKEKQVIILHDPSVPKIEWYVEGVLAGTQSTAAKIPSGVGGGVPYLSHSIQKNAATTTADAISYLMRPVIWQAR